MTERNLVIVSGGSRGLGRAIVSDLLAHKYIVASFSRNPTPFTRSQSQADPECKRFYWQALDSCDAGGVKAFVKEISRRYGRIDGLVNNAGQNKGGFLNLTRLPHIQKLLQVNLEAVMNLTRLVVPHMLTQSSGSIINLSSISGHRGFAGLTTYAATKSGLDGFMRCLAREVGSRFVRVNSVAPGLLETDMAKTMPAQEREQMERFTPMGRIGRCEDVVGLIRFLLSPESAFITGQSIVVDGGFTC